MARKKSVQSTGQIPDGVAIEKEDMEAAIELRAADLAENEDLAEPEAAIELRAANLAENEDLAEPENRLEGFLASIGGLSDSIPEGEYTRLERYLSYIAGYLPTAFAPAGYGLGGDPVRLKNKDLDTVGACGFYWWSSTDGVTNAPYTDTSFCFCIGYCQMVFPRGSNNGKIAFRTKASAWNAWYELTGSPKS